MVSASQPKGLTEWSWEDVRSWLNQQPALARYAKKHLKVKVLRLYSALSRYGHLE